MWCVAQQTCRRVGVGQVQGRLCITKSHDFFGDIKKVGLADCVESYFSDEPCSNNLCCKNAFFEVDCLTKAMSAEIRTNFLKKIDKDHNRLEMAIIIKDKYNQLEKIKKNINASGLQEINPEQYKHLMKLVGYQQFCLRNQFAVIRQSSPTITTMPRFALSSCPIKGLKVKIVEHYTIDGLKIEE